MNKFIKISLLYPPVRAIVVTSAIELPVGDCGPRESAYGPQDDPCAVSGSWLLPRVLRLRSNRACSSNRYSNVCWELERPSVECILPQEL